MEITCPRTCNGNYTPRDLYCTPWESCGEGAYWNLLFYCRGVLTVLKSIHPRRGKKNDDDNDDHDDDNDANKNETQFLTGGAKVCHVKK